MTGDYKQAFYRANCTLIEQKGIRPHGQSNSHWNHQEQIFAFQLNSSENGNKILSVRNVKTNTKSFHHKMLVDMQVFSQTN